ncbi:MAG: hypothetical protein FJ096_05695 [Deltaproteobacteria bacterium]|nr:hypothetical protein [Deltaproteobacteria bacterium]
MTDREGDGRGLPPTLAGTIHDAANALTVVLGWLERAKHAGADREEALVRAARHARWSHDQLRRVLGAVEPPSDSSEPTARAGAVLTRTAEDLAFEAERACVDLNFVIAPEAGPTFVSAATELWQVLTNLLLNALALSPRGGVVTLSLERLEDARVRFAIEDDGPGIPDSRRPTLFEGGTSTRAHGAGLGLRGAHALARGLGGELRLASSSERGARFELDWPCMTSINSCVTAAPPDAKPEGHLGTERRSGVRTDLAGLRVALLEDDEAVLELLDLSLRARGAELRLARTATEFGRTLEDPSIDVALFDLSPLGDEPLAAIERLVDTARTHPRGLPLIAVSGSAAASLHPDVLVLRKPFSPDELARTIARAAARRA